MIHTRLEFGEVKLIQRLELCVAQVLIAISRRHRGRESTDAEMIVKIGTLLGTLWIAAQYYGPENVKRIRTEKLERLKERVDAHDHNLNTSASKGKKI